MVGNLQCLAPWLDALPDPAQLADDIAGGHVQPDLPALVTCPAGATATAMANFPPFFV